MGQGSGGGGGRGRGGEGEGFYLPPAVKSCEKTGLFCRCAKKKVLGQSVQCVGVGRMGSHGGYNIAGKENA